LIHDIYSEEIKDNPPADHLRGIIFIYMKSGFFQIFADRLGMNQNI